MKFDWKIDRMEWCALQRAQVGRKSIQICRNYDKLCANQCWQWWYHYSMFIRSVDRETLADFSPEICHKRLPIGRLVDIDRHSQGMSSRRQIDRRFQNRLLLLPSAYEWIAIISTNLNRFKPSWALWKEEVQTLPQWARASVKSRRKLITIPMKSVTLGETMMFFFSNGKPVLSLHLLFLSFVFRVHIFLVKSIPFFSFYFQPKQT